MISLPRVLSRITVLILLCLCFAAYVLLLDGVDGRVHDSVSYCCKSI